MAKKRKQAYKELPWRRQIRALGFSVLPIIAIVFVTALHLVISARSAAAGLIIMEYHYEEEEILRKIANQRTELAWISSYREMQNKAKNLGFVDIPNEDIQFITLAGYPGKSGVLATMPSDMKDDPTPLINDFYQISLWDWFSSTFFLAESTSPGDKK